MRRRLLRVLAVVAVAVGVLVVLGLAGGWWLIGTQPGTRWGFERLGAILPGEIKVDQVRGPLRGPLTIFGFHYKTPQIDLAIDRLALDWQLRELAARRLDIHWLEADGVRIVLATSPQTAQANPDTTPLPDVNLPVRIVLRTAQIRNVAITPAGSESTLAITAVDAQDLAFHDTLHVGRLSMRSPHLDVEVAGHARTHGGYTADLTTVWAVREPSLPELRGHGHLSGDLDTLHVVQDVDAPMTAHVDALAFQLLRALRFHAALDVHGFDARAWNPAWPAGTADAQAVVDGTPDAFRARGTVAAATADWGRVSAVYAVARDVKQIRIDTLAVTPGTGGRLAATGRVTTAGKTMAVDLRGGWQNLGWPLTGARRVVSPRGTFQLTGPVDAYHIALNADVGTPQIKPSPWTLDGNGTAQSLAVRSLRGAVLGGGVDARGDVTWAPAIGWRLAMAGHGLDPATAFAGWPGSLGFSGRSEGRVTRAGPSGSVALDSLTGTLKQHPVSGAGSATFTPGSIAIPNAAVAWGSDSVTASGTAGASYAMGWAVVGRDLSLLLPNGSGTLIARGRLTGPRRTPRITAAVRGDSMLWQGGRVASLQGTVDVSTARTDSSRVDVEASGLMAGSQAIDHVALRGGGTIEAHQVRVDATAEQDSVAFEAHGGVDRGVWRGEIARLDLTTGSTFGRWGLVQPAAVTASTQAATLANFCFASGAQQLCAHGDWSATTGWRADATLHDVNVATFRPLLPDALQMSAPVNGSMTAHGIGTTVAGDVRLDVGAGDIAYTETGKPTHLPLRGAALVANAGAHGLDARATIDFGATDSIGAVAHFPQFGSAVATGSQRIHGELRASIVDLGVVQGVVPQLARTRGTLTANLAVDGTASNPEWRGEAKLVDGGADVPLLGLKLTDGTMDARSDANGHLTFAAGARSGQGDVQLAGTASIAANGTPSANATLQGHHLTVAARQDMRAIVSPDLKLALVQDSLRVRGDITVNQADVQLRKPKPGAISPDPDIVYVDSTTRVPPAKPKAQLTTAAAVRLILVQDSVRVRGYGLDAKPTGAVFAIVRSDGTANGSGALTVSDGSYQAYGQKFTIESGALTFAGGPLANPGLSVKADRTAGDGTVAGFNVTGTLEQPQLTVFSDPVMDDRDALSYALIGRPVNSSTKSEQGIVSEAASSLSLTGGSYVASQLASQFGISEASLAGGGTVGGTSLNLGTYVSPRVFVTYGLSILDPVQRLRIQYFLNRMWTLQAETGAQNSADILYTVEH